MSAKIKYMGFFFSVLAIVVLGVVFLGNDERDARDSNYSGRAVQQTQTISGYDQHRMSFGYIGDKSQIISLNKGKASIYLEYPGYATFKAKLLQLDGALVADLSDANGPYRQTQIIDVPETGDYILDVKTSGEWSFSRE